MIHRGVIYLSGVRDYQLDRVISLNDDAVPLGIMVTPLTDKRDKYLNGAGNIPWIGIDNGCFSAPQNFHLPSYLDLCRRGADLENVRFATAPDVFNMKTFKGDWQATLQKSLPILPIIRKAGCPAAIVIQDGATIETVPWDEIDCVFIGASTEWKVGPECRVICHEARRRGKWVHMGRVNSLKRIFIARDFGCDSVDGTHMLHHDDGLDNIMLWVRETWKMDRKKSLWNAKQMAGREERAAGMLRMIQPFHY